MPPSRHSQQPSKIVSYHYDIFNDRRMQINELNITSCIEAHSSTVNSPSHLPEGTEGSYTISTSELYRQRNVHLRPLIPRREIESQMGPASMSSMRDSIETICSSYFVA